MKKVRKRWGLGAALILGAGTLLAAVVPTAADAATAGPAPSCTISTQQVLNAGHAQHVGGVVAAQGTSTASNCTDPPAPPEPPFNGTPPLLFHGSPQNCTFAPCEDGKVMMTRSTGPLTVTPIFWNPSNYPMTLSYKAIITAYLGAVALSSGLNSNVFSVADEYYGTNGKINYNVRLGLPVNDTHALPASGCTLESADRSGIYADGSGYSACLDDTQLQAEVDSVTAARGLRHNLSNIYVLFLPKHVESCFLPGQTTDPSNGQACTVNYEPTAAYCAYHSESLSSAVYANLDYPIYSSKTGFTCGSEFNFGVVESPNHNPDADTEVSPTSHEINEAITDPDTETGWYDSSGFENGDECAYIYGATNGQPGALYNQTILGLHFLTQQEFSNRVFKASGGTAGCVDSKSAE